mgnify:CR=1 FL=1
MDRIQRDELIMQLESYVSFHEEKANYYNNWMIEEQLKLSTIGFITTDNVLKDKICFTTINSDSTTIEY